MARGGVYRTPSRVYYRPRRKFFTTGAEPMTVTATQGGSTFNGMALAVKVLTSAAAVQDGAVASSTTIGTPQLAITPEATGSWVYGSVVNANGTTSWSALGTTTFTQNLPDATNGSCYGTYRSTATTTASTPVTLGASAPSVTSGGIAQAEILADGTLAEDGSAPAAVDTSAAQTVSTASFTPPAGSLLVAIVSSDGGEGTCTMTVSGGGLSWTEMVAANGTGDGYAGVWIAQVPDEGGEVQAVTGACFAGGSAASTAVKAAPVTGSSLAGGSSQATRTTIVAADGASAAGATSLATAAKRAIATGHASSGAAARATAVKRTAQTGALSSGVTAAATAVKRAAVTGICSAGAATSGAGRKAAPQTGAAHAGAASLATGKHVAPRTGNAPAGASSTGAARKVKAITGTSSAGVAATHSGISTRAVTGACSAGTSATGSAQHVTARTGTAAVGCFTRGTGVHLAPRTGDSPAGTGSHAAVVKKAQPTGLTGAGVTGSGVLAKTVALTGLTAAGALPAYVSTARAVVGHCYGGAWGRHRRRYTYRPVTGTTARPGSGTIPRPYSSVTERP